MGRRRRDAAASGLSKVKEGNLKGTLRTPEWMHGKISVPYEESLWSYLTYHIKGRRELHWAGRVV